MKPLRFLYISYFLPPLGRAESRHNVAWLRELVGQGWSAEVLTANLNEDYPRDESLSDYMPKSGAQLHPILKRAEGGKVFRKFRYLSGFIDLAAVDGWESYLEYAMELHSAESFDFVYSVYGVPLSHEIARQFKIQTGVPWVAEFRDPLIGNRIIEKILDKRCWPFWRKRQLSRMREFEGRVARESDLLVVASELHEQKLAHEYSISHSKIGLLGLGFDSKQFPESARERLTPSAALRIGYIGSLYEGYEFIAEMIVKSLAEIDHPLEFTVVGDDRAVFKRFARHYQLSGFNHVGRVGQVEALSIMQEMDIGILIIDENYNLMVSKFWEYLYAGMSIVALVPKLGDMGRWLEKNQAGYLLPYSERGIQIVLKKLIEDANAGRLKRVDPDLVKEYDARLLVRQIAERVQRIVSKKDEG